LFQELVSNGRVHKVDVEDFKDAAPKATPLWQPGLQLTMVLISLQSLELVSMVRLSRKMYLLFLLAQQ
jgi:hypothetical protein